MRYPAYPEYKESGVQWLGRLPGHWEVKATNRVFQLHSGSTPKSGEELFWDGDIIWFTPEDLGNNQQKSITDSKRKITADGYKSCGTSLAKANSIVISTRAPIGHLALSTVSACCNQGCRILEPIHGVPDYWYYVFVTTKSVLNALGQGSTFMELPRQSLANFKLPVPPVLEQSAIADFLDRETGRIDMLMAKKRRLIELLREKRSALISRTVTRGLPEAATCEFGLEPHTRFKDSGIARLGDVPEGWDVKRLKYSVSINDEALSEKTDPDFEFYYIDIGSVSPVDGIINREPMVFENAPSRARRKVLSGDTIVSTVRTYLRAITPIPETAETLIVSTGFAVVRPRKINSAFLAYALRETSFVEDIVSRSTGVSYPAVNASEIGDISITVPSQEEQIAIASYLDRETAKIDRLVEKVEEALDRLQEYRTALITAAVTGKIDVRGAARSDGKRVPFHEPEAVHG